MTQIPLLSGIAATERADFDIAYPVNLEGVPLSTGLSKGYIRSAAGVRQMGTGPGNDRGGVVWNGIHYRVMGTKLVSLSATGAATVLSDVGDGGPVALNYGFDRLAINSGNRLYYWSGSALTQVTDPDLGVVNDMAWFKGQFFTTDGFYIVATQLADPTQVDPNKYGSAESDPDMITGLGVIRNELVAFGSNTIDFFTYTGGSGFPLSLNDGASIPIGCVGPRAKCIFVQTYAFVGGGRNEGNAVWLMGSGTASKISTRAIDDLLAAELNPEAIRLEARVSRDEHRLYVHLSDKTLVYLHTASQAAQEAIWYVARSGLGMDKPYRPRNAVLLNGQWWAGDNESASIGVLDEAIGSHFGEAVGWELYTQLLYNQAKGGIVHTLEMVGLPGRGTEEGAPVCFLSFTEDGQTWSQERPARMGKRGDRGQRLFFAPHRRIRRYLGMRFRGSSAGLAGFAALEAEIEPLRV